MIQQKLRKVGNSYVVTIPKAEVERRGLTEGELIELEIVQLEVRPKLRPEIREIIDRNWERDEPAYRYLGGES